MLGKKEFRKLGLAFGVLCWLFEFCVREEYRTLTLAFWRAALGRKEFRKVRLAFGVLC